MLAHYDTKNPEALLRLVASGVNVSVFPRDVLDTMYKAAEAFYAAIIASNPAFAKILSFRRISAQELQLSSGRRLPVRSDDAAAEAQGPRSRRRGE